MVDPIYQWTPSPALSSLLIYKGKEIPSLTNKLLIPSLKAATLFVVTLDGRKTENITSIIQGEIGRIRNVKASSHGVIYLISDNGALYRIRAL
jgi:glucose/arabinose dehydrogenase